MGEVAIRDRWAPVCWSLGLLITSVAGLDGAARTLSHRFFSSVKQRGLAFRGRGVSTQDETAQELRTDDSRASTHWRFEAPGIAGWIGWAVQLAPAELVTSANDWLGMAAYR